MSEKYLQKFSVKSKNVLILIPVLFGAWLTLTSLNGLVPGLGIYDGKRILELYLILITLALALLNTPVRLQFNAILKSIPSWIRIFILIFFGLGLFSALRTPHPAYPLVDVAMLFLVTITAIVMACIRLVTGKLFDRIVNDYSIRAKVAECINGAVIGKVSISEYRKTLGAWPPNLEEAGLAIAGISHYCTALNDYQSSSGAFTIDINEAVIDTGLGAIAPVMTPTSEASNVIPIRMRLALLPRLALANSAPALPMSTPQVFSPLKCWTTRWMPV